MKTKLSGGKIALILILILMLGLGGFGYFKQASELSRDDNANAANVAETDAAAKPMDASLLKPNPADVILGDINALVTIVEYSSLSCPHCAHFHTDVLPALQKEFITPGKVKLVMRPFPLNEPALRGAQLVECAGNNGLQRANFIKVLFDMQSQWAFGDSFMSDLKRIALVGGIDSAAFESCIADKDIETRILVSRQTAADKLGVTSTPSFFVNGKKLEGGPTVESFRAAIASAPAAGK